MVSDLFNFVAIKFALATPSALLYFKSILLLKFIVSINLEFKNAGVI